MKKQAIVYLTATAVCGLMALANTALAQTNAAPRTFCRFVPERLDDFAWENDKVAFRAYGMAARDGDEDGGIDCWLKRVHYPIINKWYQEDKEGQSYHDDHGEGYDPYHVGSTLGCGGIGLWLDDQLVTTETFVSWKVIKCEPEESVFELNYAWDYDGHSYSETKHCTIRLGDQMFLTTATFWKDDEPAKNLPVAIGLTTHDGQAIPSKDLKAGWIACWEDIDGAGLGTGVVIDPSKIKDYKEILTEDHDKSHVLIISQTDEKGQVSWWAGYGWARAGEITNAMEWEKYLAAFAKRVALPPGENER